MPVPIGQCHSQSSCQALTLFWGSWQAHHLVQPSSLQLGPAMRHTYTPLPHGACESRGSKEADITGFNCKPPPPNLLLFFSSIFFNVLKLLVFHLSNEHGISTYLIGLGR